MKMRGVTAAICCLLVVSIAGARELLQSGCASCGNAFGACCSDGSCTAGTTCVGDGNKICAPCGHVGEDCCGGTQCSGDGSLAAFCNGIKKCEACGDIFLSCCPGNVCNNPGTSCMNGKCMPQPSEPYGKACKSDSDCSSPTSDKYTCSSGSCLPCGKPSRPACGNNQCSGSYVAQQGFCHFAGNIYNYCNKDGSCNAQPWGTLSCQNTQANAYTSGQRCVVTNACPGSKPTAPTQTTNSGSCGKVFAPCCSDGSCTDPATKCNGDYKTAGTSVCSPCGQLGEDCCTSGAACREQQATTFCNSINKCEACGDWFLKCCPGNKCINSALTCSNGMCVSPTNATPQRGNAIPQQTNADGTCNNGLAARDGFCHVCGDFFNYCCDGGKCNAQPWGNLKCSQDRCVPA